MKEKSEFSEVLNKAGEHRRKDRSNSCFFGKMVYIFDDSRKKKKNKDRSFFSFLIAGEACEMRGSEMKTEMKNSNGNKHGEKETDKKGSDVNNQENNRVASH